MSMTLILFVENERPPLIKGCPKSIENLMKSCWDEAFQNRPTMEIVVEAMNIFCKYFKDGERLDYSQVRHENDNTNYICSEAAVGLSKMEELSDRERLNKFFCMPPVKTVMKMG